MKRFTLFELNFIMEIISFVLLYKAVFCSAFLSSKKRIFLFIVMIVVSGGFVYNLFDEDLYTLSAIVFYLSTSILVRANRLKQWFILFVPAALFLSSFDASNLFLLNIIHSTQIFATSMVSVEYLFTKLMTLAELVVIILIRDKLWNDDTEHVMEAFQLVNYYVYAIVLLFMISETEIFIENIEHTSRLEIFTLLSNSVIYFLIIGTCIYQNHLKIVLVSQNDKILRYEEFTELQKEHLETIIIQDTHFKRFRHDLKAHLMQLSALSRDNDAKELQAYCDKLINESALESIDHYTGDSGIDAILSYMKRTAVSRDIAIDYHIQMPSEPPIDKYDLCTILSNLLQNSIEAASKAEPEPFIVLNMYIHDENLIIVTRNSAICAPVLSAGGFLTTKDNPSEHGFGMKNIIETVEKYNGRITNRFDDGVFSVNICITLY